MCFLVAGMILSGCAAIKQPEKPEKPREPQGEEAIQVPSGKKEIMVLASRYEDERQFKKTLNALKEAQVLDPRDKELSARVEKLEAGLNDAIGKHMRSGKYFYGQRALGKAKKEFLLVLFLDPENRGAVKYLRRLAGVAVPKTSPDEVWVKPADNGAAKDFIIHTLKPGESLSILASMYYGDIMKYGVIADFNSIRDMNKVSVGRKIRIPVLENMVIQEKADKAAPRQEPEPFQKAAPEKAETTMREVSVRDEERGVKEEVENGYPAEGMHELHEAPKEDHLAKLDDGYSDETFLLAEKLFEEDQFEKAMGEYKKVLNKYPAHPLALKQYRTSEKIVSHLKEAGNLYSTRKYGKAYDKYRKALDLKPESPLVSGKMEKLTPPMLTQAKYLLNDEQSPCGAIALIEKILKVESDNREAQDLLDEATMLEEGLDLRCGEK